jgi:hypothetical protein
MIASQVTALLAILGFFLLGVFWLVYKLVKTRITMMRAIQVKAEVPSALFKDQASVITDVISELEVNKLSYGDFPPELENRLMQAHEAWDSQRKGIR